MLREAIQKLPTQYRIVLVLRDMEGLTDEDVAEVTELRAGTVQPAGAGSWMLTAALYAFGERLPKRDVSVKRRLKLAATSDARR